VILGLGAAPLPRISRSNAESRSPDLHLVEVRPAGARRDPPRAARGSAGTAPRDPGPGGRASGRSLSFLYQEAAAQLVPGRSAPRRAERPSRAWWALLPGQEHRAFDLH
jgi:hypothetical protein